MLRNNPLTYLWCLVIGGVFLLSILRGDSSIYHFFAAWDSSRWVHFLAYTLVTAIPVAACTYRRDVLVCLVPAIMSITFESLQMHVLGLNVRTQIIVAGLFGIAAGILLGLNIRVMRNSARSLENGRSDSSHSALS
jgi:uncharacterized membrane protein